MFAVVYAPCVLVESAARSEKHVAVGAKKAGFFSVHVGAVFFTWFTIQLVSFKGFLATVATGHGYTSTPSLS